MKPIYLLLGAGTVLCLALAGCAGTSGGSEDNPVSIGVLLQDAQGYDDREVTVAGEVASSVGLFGNGAYDLKDGTGTITVLTGEQGLPKEGTRVLVTGEFEAVQVVGDQTASVIKERDRKGI